VLHSADAAGAGALHVRCIRRRGVLSRVLFGEHQAPVPCILRLVHREQKVVFLLYAEMSEGSASGVYDSLVGQCG
jgi:hypothetical protein